MIAVAKVTTVLGNQVPLRAMARTTGLRGNKTPRVSPVPRLAKILTPACPESADHTPAVRRPVVIDAGIGRTSARPVAFYCDPPPHAFVRPVVPDRPVY